MMVSRTPSAQFLKRNFLLLKDFVNICEHNKLLEETQQALRKTEWNREHFDSVIRNYRETVIRSNPSSAVRYPSIEGLKASITRLFFPTITPCETHILELAEDGYILPHLDNYCGDIIVGLSLSGHRIIRFTKNIEKSSPGELYEPDQFEVELPPLSLYLQRDSLRWKYQHEILPGKDGRTSILFREPPTSNS